MQPFHKALQSLLSATTINHPDSADNEPGNHVERSAQPSTTPLLCRRGGRPGLGKPGLAAQGASGMRWGLQRLHGTGKSRVCPGQPRDFRVNSGATHRRSHGYGCGADRDGSGGIHSVGAGQPEWWRTWAGKLERLSRESGGMTTQPWGLFMPPLPMTRTLRIRGREWVCRTPRLSNAVDQPR